MHSYIPDYLAIQATTPKQNILGQLYLNEVEAFQKKCMQSMTATPSDPTKYFIDPSTLGTLVPVDPKMSSFAELTNNRRQFKPLNYGYIFQNVIKKILTLNGTFSFEEAIVEINKFKEKAGLHFYGAVLRKGDKLINPYHILTPISYMKNKEVFNDKYTVLLFFYSNINSLFSDGFKRPDADKGDKEYCETLLNNIIKCSNHQDVEIKAPNNLEGFYTNKSIATPSDRATTRSYARNSFEDLKYHVLQADEITEKEFLELNYVHQTSIGSSKNDTYLLSAHQIMVNGVFAPEYGVSLLKKSRNSLYGTFLTPSASCNIQSDSLKKSLTFASVCTGRESQSTLKGISSLHCCNYASAYNSSSHSDLSVIFAKESIEKCTTIYDKIGILPKTLKDTPTPEELERIANFADYITYMTETFKLSLMEIEARYQTIKGQQNGKEKEKTAPEANNANWI